MYFEFLSCVRGHHVYKSKWQPVIGEVLNCEVEPDNPHDKHAVAITRTKDGSTDIVGHVPRENSKVIKYFLSRGGTIEVVITGSRENQGIGLQVPAKYKFTGSKSDIAKLPKLLKN